MGETTTFLKSNICLGCLCKNVDKELEPYYMQNQIFKAVVQVEDFFLCFICKKIAQRLDQFIQNIQSNQIFLENIHNITESMLQSARGQTELLHLSSTTLETIEAGFDDDSNIDDKDSSCVVYGSSANRSNEFNVKLEMKQEVGELLDHLEEGAFVEDDFQDVFVKEEDYPLKELMKEELGLTEGQLTSRGPRKTKKNKFKSKSLREINHKKDLNKIQTIYLSKQECLEERKEMAKDKKYLKCAYKCEDCIKGFTFKDSYEKHMERHSESNGDYVCDICTQKMCSEEKLASHRRYHQIRYKCPACDLIRISRLTIQDHYSAYHMDSYYHYSCTQCSKTFKRQVSLRKHMLYAHRNKERVSCAYCDKTYATKEVLKAHMVARHAKEVSAGEVLKRHKCHVCGMAFKAPSHLQKHMIKHSVDRDFYCVECDKSFKSDSILKHHLKTAAPHVNYIELPLGCLHCDKRFAIRRDLDRHTNRVHLNIKPFQCDQCDKAYVNGWSLTEHKRLIHEGYKRPLKFPCPMCDKVFDRKQILKGHIRTHTGERPFQCSKCHAQFSQRSILGTHYKLIHLNLTRDGRPKTVALK